MEIIMLIWRKYDLRVVEIPLSLNLLWRRFHAAHAKGPTAYVKFIGEREEIRLWTAANMRQIWCCYDGVV
jgi:hypothetical protein